MYKAIIFDFDYTLGDSTDGIVKSVNYAMSKLGLPQCEREDVRFTVGHTLPETFKMLTGDSDLQKASQFSEYFIEKADEIMTEHSKLFEFSQETLEAIKEKGYKTGICTTKHRYRIDAILEKYDAGDLVDQIVGADDVSEEKPSPEGLLWLIDCFGVDKSDVLYIGDSLVDAETAENAGVDFGAVLTGTTSLADFSDFPCEFVCENVSDIVKKGFL